jgi:hypothetical protein
LLKKVWIVAGRDAGAKEAYSKGQIQRGGQAKATTQWLVDGLHPTLPSQQSGGDPGSPKTRRMAHPFCFGCPKETRTTADPYGMTTRKANNKGQKQIPPLLLRNDKEGRLPSCCEVFPCWVVLFDQGDFLGAVPVF